MGPFRRRESAAEYRFNEAIVALLGVATITMVALPFFVHSTAVIVTSRMLVALFLISAVVRRSPHPWFKAFVVGIAFLDLLVHRNWIWEPGHALTLAGYVLSLTFLVTTAGFLTRELWRETEVGAAMIFMSIGIYGLIGLIWEVAFSLLEFSASGSFAGLCGSEQGMFDCAVDPDDFPRLRYLAFVTITTLGYGDVVPVTRAGEGLVTLAALTGQLFLAILIGRLVGASMAKATASK
jgi:hypothetical protein